MGVNPDVWRHASVHDQDRFAHYTFASGLRDPCWIWTGGIESDGGYSRYRTSDGPVVAGHRWSYQAANGALPSPVIRHRCDIRCCVNPAHLIAGTQAENIADTIRRGHWTTYAHQGPRSWPTLAYRLRELARQARHTLDTSHLDQLLDRPEQLALFPESWQAPVRTAAVGRS